MSSTPRSETVYLHLKPGQYPADLNVSRMTKSLSASVEPGIVIVKARITVPAEFFNTARPYAEIEFKPTDAIEPAAVSISTVTEEAQ